MLNVQIISHFPTSRKTCRDGYPGSQDQSSLTSRLITQSPEGLLKAHEPGHLCRPTGGIINLRGGGDEMATIMHVDMDSFFAAVEQRDNPELRGKPVIVGGPRDSKRGVVSTCSYEARKYGVHSAMPIAQAVKLCPHGIFIPGNHKKYAAVSRQIRSVFYEFSPVVETVSIDEAFLDMTGCEHLYES